MRRIDFTLPAEWAEQSGIMLVWPHANTDWRPYLSEITETFLSLADIITRHEQLLITAPDTAVVKRQLEGRLSKEQMDQVILFECDSNDTWARDIGPLSLVSRANVPGFFVNRHLLDFHFNGWGEKFAAEKDDAINLQLYYGGIFHAALENHTDFVLEGGAIESDGQGSIMVTASSMLAPHRNQPLSQRDIENRLTTLFHARQILWINHGHVIGDDTDGHIDTLCRFAPNDTILYIGTDDAGDAQYADLKAMEDELRGLRNADGKPFRLMRLPVPDAIYDGADRLPATYANFVVLNDAVIVPTYGQEEKDEQAKAVIASVFPTRQVYGVDALTAIRQHGSLHCLTMHFPQGVIEACEEARKFD